VIGDARSAEPHAQRRHRFGSGKDKCTAVFSTARACVGWCRISNDAGPAASHAAQVALPYQKWLLRLAAPRARLASPALALCAGPWGILWSTGRLMTCNDPVPNGPRKIVGESQCKVADTRGTLRLLPPAPSSTLFESMTRALSEARRAGRERSIQFHRVLLTISPFITRRQKRASGQGKSAPKRG